MSFVKQKNKAFTTEEIISNIFNIKKNSNKYGNYREAVESFLIGNKDFNKVHDGTWYYGSKPVIRPTVLSSIEGTDQITQTLTYIERVKGYIKVSQQLASQTKVKLRKHGTLVVVFDECSYEFQWKWLDNYCYLFGNGIMDFYSDAALQPDQEFTFKIRENQIEIIIPKQNLEAVSQVEHTQLNQIEESMQKEKERPIFTILYELLSCFPAGLNMKEIYTQFLDYKLVTSYELKNVLKQNECFEYDVVEDMWKVNVNKISRYYKDEHGNQSENQLSYVWLIGEEGAVEPVKDTQEKNNSVNQEPLLDNLKALESIYDTKDSEEFSIDPIVIKLKEIFIDPQKFKEEINGLVIECFNIGEINALETSYKEAQKVYNYLLKVEQLLNNWKGNEV